MKLIIRLYWSGNVIDRWDGTAYTQIGTATWTANTFHKIDVEWETTTDTHRVRVDDGTWTSWTAGNASWVDMDTIAFSISSDLATNRDYYFDTIGPAAVAAGNNVVFFGTNF